jgi:dTMP kinase
MFIVVEGIDLIGKTTQHELLVQYLRSRGRTVSPYSFPDYGSPTGKVVSEHLRGRVVLDSVNVGPLTVVATRPVRSEYDSLAFQCLQLVDKYAAAPLIMADLAQGLDVVACRWWQSAYAYGLGDGLGEDWVVRTCSLLPRADVNVLLDLDPSKARRRPGALLDRLESDQARQAMLRQRYLDLWRCRDGGEEGLWAVVDAEGEAGDVHGRVLAVLGAAGICLGGRRGREA